MDVNNRENECELVLKNETYQIVGAAMEVSTELGTGFLEAVYQEALAVEFENRGIPYQEQDAIQIRYKNRVLNKQYFADFVCYGQIIVEIKAVKELTSIEEAQLLNYLRATAAPLGILLNFGGIRLEWKRFANTRS